MGETTGIAWTDHTFNPWMGCTKVSPGCKNCYAEALVVGRMGRPLWGPSAARQRTKSPWRDVERWDMAAERDGVRRRVFCGSLCDVFEDHPDANAHRTDLWDTIRRCTALDWQLLTKRPANILSMLPPDWGTGWPHVWIGCTIESDATAGRADDLRRVPAVVRFISYEPALGPLDTIDLTGIHWVIYGGESGPNYRQDNDAWPRRMRLHCERSGVAFFYKQASARRPGTAITLDGKVIQQFPR